MVCRRDSDATWRCTCRGAETRSTFDVGLLGEPHRAEEKRRQLMLFRLHGRGVVLAVETGPVFRVAFLLRLAMFVASRFVLLLSPNQRRLCLLLRNGRSRSGHDRSSGLHGRDMVVVVVGAGLVLALAYDRVVRTLVIAE